MAKLAVLAVLASLLGTVSCEISWSFYFKWGYEPTKFGLLPYLSPYPRTSPAPTPALKLDYYNYTKCPRAEDIVRDTVVKANDAGVYAGLVRLFFHDCFVQGCDASVLLNQTANGTDTERKGFPNLTLRGFEVIDAARDALDKQCKCVDVSCADILAFAARDASYILSNGGIDYKVPGGRFDGKVSEKNDTICGNLPPPFANLTMLTEIFAKKGLSRDDMVMLSGAHSIGRSSCASFADRLPPPNPSTNTSMNSTIGNKLTATCNEGSVNVDQDYKTPNNLDIQYYKNVKNQEVLFNSDAVLKSSETIGLVNLYIENGGDKKWYDHFAKAMVKMGNIEVKTGTSKDKGDGEIRKVCWKFNT